MVTPAQTKIGSRASGVELLRALSLFDAVMILVGSVIGSGIFLVPSSIAAELKSFSLVIGVWLAGGLLSLFGALTYAELGSMIPHAGGQYAYLRETYGKAAAFLFGWTELLVIKAGSIAAVAVAFAMYLGYFVPLGDTGVKLVAIACIAFLTTVNYLGVKAGAFVQNVFTILKVGALGALILLAFALGDPSKSSFQPLWPAGATPGLVGSFGVALVAVLWAYDGWNNVTYIAAEVREPQRNIPLALFIGMAIIFVVYGLAAVAYNYVLPLSVMAQSELVAADTARALIGPIGGALIAGAVMISTFGTVNGMILSGPRVTYSMAQDKVFFQKLGDVHSRFRTPHCSVVVQGVWSALLTLTGRFDQLFTYVVFVAWVFYAMTTAGVFVLRRRRPDAHRSYRTLGYPWVPAVFICVSAWFVINTLVNDPRDSLFGLIIVALGVPVYLYWRRKNEVAKTQAQRSAGSHGRES